MRTEEEPCGVVILSREALLERLGLAVSNVDSPAGSSDPTPQIIPEVETEDLSDGVVTTNAKLTFAPPDHATEHSITMSAAASSSSARALLAKLEARIAEASSSTERKLVVEQPKELTDLGVEAYYVPNFLSKEEADETLKVLLAKFPFHQEKTTMNIGGKKRTFDQPRLTRFMGDDGKAFKYSGHVRPAVPWIPEVLALRDRIAAFQRTLRKDHPDPNVVLGNMYEHGGKYIAFHADDEKDHEDEAFITGLSVGAPRDFVLKDKKTMKTVFTILLEHGSLFLMGRNFHQKLKHGLPKRLKVKDPRINLTFRTFSNNRSVEPEENESDGESDNWGSGEDDE